MISLKSFLLIKIDNLRRGGQSFSPVTGFSSMMGKGDDENNFIINSINNLIGKLMKDGYS